MPNFLKLAYEAGVEEALRDHGAPKVANLVDSIKSDLGKAELDWSRRQAEKARKAASPRRKALVHAAAIAAGVAGAAPGIIMGKPVAAAAGHLLAYPVGMTLSEMAAIKGVRDSMFVPPSKLSLLREYLRGKYPTGAFARGVGLTGLAGLGAASLYSALGD